MPNVVEEAVSAVDAAKLVRLAPGVTKELAGMEQALITRVFDAISNNTLTPQQAHYAWLELLTYRRLARRLTTKAKMGEALLEKAAL